MNNIKKFEETQKALLRLKRQMSYLEEEVQSKFESGGLHSKSYTKALEKDLRIKQLSIDKNSGHVIFQSNTLGDYMQPIKKSKRRINAIPLCFLFQLYQEDLQVNNEQVNIPFTLRGFWQIDTANEFVKKLINLQISMAEIIEKQICLYKNNSRQLSNLTKILHVIKSLEIFVLKDKYEIYFEEKKFTVNMKNRKLDVVPLCKILTSYYVRIINYIESYKNTLEVTEDTEDIYKIKADFRKLMERYFVIYLL